MNRVRLDILILITGLAPLLFLLFPFGLSAEDKIDSLLKLSDKVYGKDRIRVYNEISLEYSEKSTDKCLMYAYKAMKLAEKLGDRKGIALSYNNIGNGYNFSRQYRIATEYYQKAVKLYSDIDDKEGLAKPLNNLGVMYFKMKDYDKALEYYEKSLEVREEIGNPESIADALFNIGIFQSNRGNYQKALEYYRLSLNIREDIEDKQGIFNTLKEFGRIYKILGDYDKVIEYSLKSLNVVEEIGEKSGIAVELNKIGNIYYALGDYTKALEYHQRSLKISKDLGNKTAIAKSLNNIGNVYYDQNNFEKALEYYDKSLALAKETGDGKGIAMLYNNIGLVYMDMREYPKALEYCMMSLELKQKTGDFEQISTSMHSIGLIYSKLGEYDKALDFAKKNLDVALEKNSKKVIQDAYLLLYEIYNSTSNYKNALNYYRLYSAMKDSLTSEETRNTIAAMEVRNETEKKDKENELLRLDKDKQKRYFIAIIILILIIGLVIYSRYHTKKKANKLLTEKNIQIEKANMNLHAKNLQITSQKEELQQMFEELRRSETKLREAIATKDKFFSIIAHDLKNPLQAMILSSYLLANNYLKMDSQKLEENFKKLHKSSNYLAELLENLLQWARTQSGKIEFNPEVIDLGFIAENVVNLMIANATRKNIKINQLIQLKTFAYCDMNMISSVLRNLLTNAIKFTHNGGEINITAYDRGDYVEVNVDDNGMGIKQEDLSKLFRIDVHHTSIGTSREKGTGLGLILCREFIEKNGGRIWAESEINQGSSFKFTLPTGTMIKNLFPRQLQTEVKF